MANINISLKVKTPEQAVKGLISEIDRRAARLQNQKETARSIRDDILLTARINDLINLREFLRRIEIIPE